MAQCKAMTKGGTRCKRRATAGDHCTTHDPSKAEVLTDRQARFVEEYLVDLHGPAAVRRIGGELTDGSARVESHRMLTNANVRKAIDARLSELSMGRDEVLRRLTEHARGSMASFLVSDLSRPGGVRIDLSTDEAQLAYGLLKKLKLKTLILGEAAVSEQIEVELYSAQDALEKLGKAHSLFVDRHEHSVKGELASLAREAADQLKSLSPVELQRLIQDRLAGKHD